MPTRHDKLEALLSDLFVSTPELRRYLRGLDQGDRLVDELPGEPAAKAVVVHEAPLRMVRWRMVSDDLIRRLHEEFSNNTKDIQAFATLVAGQPGGPHPAGPNPEARFRRLVQTRVGELPAVFERPGLPHTLEDVYMDLRCDDLGTERSQVRHLRDVHDHPLRSWTVLGEAGCGKTTLLHHFALELVKTSRLPVPLRIPELRRNDLLQALTPRPPRITQWWAHPAGLSCSPTSRPLRRKGGAGEHDGHHFKPVW